MPGGLRLSRAQLQSVIDHARDCQPEEACGILAGDADGRVSRVFPMENSEHSQTFYLMDSGEQFEVFDAMEREGLELVAIFHSHPHSPPMPSGHDVSLAFYPDSIYLIVSLMDPEPECRVFNIVEGEVSETDLIIEDD